MKWTVSRYTGIQGMHQQHPAKKPCWDTNIEVQHSRLESAASRRNLLWIWVRTQMFHFTHTEHCSWSSRSQWILPVPHLAYCPPENFLQCQILAAIQDDICSQLPEGIYDPLANFASDIPDPLDSCSLVRTTSYWSHLSWFWVCLFAEPPQNWGIWTPLLILAWVEGSNINQAYPDRALGLFSR